MSTTDPKGTAPHGPVNPWNQLPNMINPAMLAYMSILNQYLPPNALSSNTQKPHTSSSIPQSINESDSNGISPQSIPRRKRTRIYSQSKTTAYTSCQSNQELLNQG
ncbi:hypothetical protein BpHYR1_003511, partial [Brachionus plicatilis]